MSQADRCLRRLAALGSLREAPILALCSPLLVPRLVCDHPLVEVISSLDPRFGPMRAEGLRRALTDWVAVISEDYWLPADWPGIDLELDSVGDVVVGEVDPPSGGGPFARAAYLWEYIHAAPPGPHGKLTAAQARWVPAGAVLYRRSRLEAAGCGPDVMARAASDMDFHQAAFERGLSFVRDPALRFEYRPPGWGVFLRDRVEWSREWAARRAGSMSGIARAAQLGARMALPAVVLARFYSRAWVRRRWRTSALAALPFACLFACAQGVGEIRGYLRPWSRRP